MENQTKHGLKIRPEGALDFVSLGALIHRLDPGIIPFRKAAECQIHVSGGEFNCAANLADCFGLRTGIVSAMADYPIGDLIAERVRAMGVKPFYKHFKHDGVAGPNMATVYSDRGHGVRGPVVFYNRSNEAAVLDRIVKNVDVLVGNEEDLQKGLGIPGPEVAAKSKLDPGAFFGMIDRVVQKHPQIKIIATTLREVSSTNRHEWSAVAWINGQTYAAPTADLNVYDRVGGGDGFASGFFYGLLTNESPADSVKLGWAHGALLTTFPGDTTMATLDQVRAFE